MRLLIALLFTCGFAAEPLNICASVPDLGELARLVGGDDVVVTSFARGGDDPHFVEARPSFTKVLAKADLLLVVGMELEIGWIPVIQQQSRNPRIATGGAGYLDASTAITPLGVPAADTDRSHGDVHPGGNPHFLADPICGLRVAAAIRDRLIVLAPERATRFAGRWQDFARRVASALFGAEQGARLAPDEVIAAAERESLKPGDAGGWFGKLRPFAGTTVVTDHDLWPYFAHRFGLRVVGFLEPKPGIAPTTRHLAALITLMQADHARAILTVPYFDPRHARLVSEQTGAVVVPLAHQVGATADAGDYLAMVGRNVEALALALSAGK